MTISGVSSISPFSQLSGVSGVSSTTQTDADGSVTSVGTTRSKRDTFRSDFASLLKAVQAGDITTAQSALATLKADVKASTAGYSPSSSASSSQPDLDALFKAVQAGDITGAQSSLASLKSDIASAATQDASPPPANGQTQGAHPHHHRHAGGSLEAAVAAAFQSVTGADSSSESAPSTAAA
ncbi:MAG: hypothetical protein JWM41_459 [Gemmatimonadetes bacterium]|nr:hypothetical protein [Gemmatimonadota bacterium]